MAVKCSATERDGKIYCIVHNVEAIKCEANELSPEPSPHSDNPQGWCCPRSGEHLALEMGFSNR
jgi:hypothetical protein